MWIAGRLVVNTSNDENAAMGYERSIPRNSRSSARDDLITMVRREISGWESMKMDSTNARRALQSLLDMNSDSVDVSNVRWRVREF